LVADAASREDLERVEVDVDRVRVTGEIDQLPDLIPVEYGKNVVAFSKWAAAAR
jgi:hypothetical protein